jgi:glycosyltransferase involved in cell wall biosynthesis
LTFWAFSANLLAMAEKKEKRTAPRKDEKISIFLIIATLDRGGAERQLVELAKRLNRGKYRPVVGCLRRKGPLGSELEQAGIRVFSPGKRGKFDPFLILRLAFLLRREKPQIVHTWMFTANTHARISAILAGVPVIIAAERSVDRGKRWYHFLIDRLLLGFTDMVVVVSEGTRRFYRHKALISNRKMRVITNGVDYEKFSEYQPVSLPDGDLVLACGRLIAAKGFVCFIQAIRLVHRQIPEAKFIILGEGPERKRLEEEISRLELDKIISLPGEVGDVRPYLSSSVLFVLPSLFEGTPNVVLEAMAAGKPVVATRIEGSAEVVIEGETGLLVPPLKPEPLAGAIFSLLKDRALCEKMGRAGQERVKRYFTMEKMVKSYEELYQKLC